MAASTSSHKPSGSAPSPAMNALQASVVMVNPGGTGTPSDAMSARLAPLRSEEHTSELQSLMRISYAVFCLKKKITTLYRKLLILSIISNDVCSSSTHLSIIHLIYRNMN